MGISKGHYPNTVKIKAIELFEQGKSYVQIQKELDISSSYTIRNWVKKFKLGGMELLLRDKRGRTGRPPKKTPL